MKAVILVESLTGNTWKAAERVGSLLQQEHWSITGLHRVREPDHAAIQEADFVLVGTWVDGLILFGQKPGGKVRQVPAMAGKRAAAFCTYAVDPGHTLAKMDQLITDRGAEPLGGFAINRRKLVDGSKEFVDRLLGVVQA